ncbi:3' terminal RNA ribose 2'-O-methyltransferase Hen1 [Allobranchiibius sp. GilTou38]|uniref:3' terminal RNA ribose 2'-O-methyltransferase Hen1 n=1 Tax=Allobranchiibius sp. GilTou38 TaxID=2815210 RepID=UPI001AA0BE4E|nr:3' terminal RNA ribose 2'-O-methyltransferase Hen1 [Allobranchiibius sp. GilTou38]
MYLTLTSSGGDATALGYLLHKHPDRAQQFSVSAGVAHVFYPEANDERCTVALMLEVDPVALVRGRRYGGDAFALSQYVNDRPYAGSSMLAVALGKVFRTAMAGRCDARPELLGQSRDLEIRVPVLPASGGAEMVRALFEPLGWAVTAQALPLDEELPAWGDSHYVDLRLRGTQVLAEALSHLYVLLPVLDSSKHYWVSQDEVEKLVRAAGDWLPAHPARELITRRYLAHQPDLVATAVSRLAEVDDLRTESVEEAPSEETPVRRPLVVQRKEAVLSSLRAAGAARVVDLGCGEGALLRELIGDPRFSEVVGVDVSGRALGLAERRLHLDRMPDSQRARLRLLQSSMTYTDDRLNGYDAIVLTEVIEHLDTDRLPALESTVFGHARPRTVIVTTPNVEHNVRYERLAAGTMRHRDHRFEWTRAEFSDWVTGVGRRTGYAPILLPVGEDDPTVGPPTQMAVFTRSDQPAPEVS